MPCSSRAFCTLAHSNLSDRKKVKRQRWSLMLMFSYPFAIAKPNDRTGRRR
jgi:hypothetical protein